MIRSSRTVLRSFGNVRSIDIQIPRLKKTLLGFSSPVKSQIEPAQYPTQMTVGQYFFATTSAPPQVLKASVKTEVLIQ